MGLLVTATTTAAARTASGLSGSPSLVGGTTTYTDPAGDAQGGPDVTTGTISTDPPTGTITITLNVPGYLPPTSDGLERDVLVWLDTDRNRATGDPQDGTEYALSAWNDSTGPSWDAGRWNGSKWVSVPKSSTMSFTRNGDELSWTVGSSDLGGATGFRFYVVAGVWSNAADDWATEDDAPDTGWWDYPSTGTAPTPAAPAAPTTTVSLMIAAPTTTPRQAVAGRQITVSFRVVFQKEETGNAIDITTGETKPITLITWAPVLSGKMVCDPSVGGKVIVHSESFKGGQARLSFVIPKSAKGKLITVRVKITATAKETGRILTATRVATLRVR